MIEAARPGFIPIVSDDAQVDHAPDYGIERFVSAACADDIEPAVGEIANARREAESQQVAEAEYVIDRAGGVGVVLADFDRAFVVHQSVENVRGFAGVRGDDLGIERRIAIGNVSVELHARFRTVLGVVVGAGLAMSAGAEKLAVG